MQYKAKMNDEEQTPSSKKSKYDDSDNEDGED